MSQFPDCDPEIFKDGLAVCTFAAPAVVTEPWVKRVAADSGQRVDWHYSGGRVNMLYLGDYAKVKASVEKLLPELDAACREHRRAQLTQVAPKERRFETEEYGVEAFGFFGEGSRGLYRAGDLG
jgi:hypothetical protein